MTSKVKFKDTSPHAVFDAAEREGSGKRRGQGGAADATVWDLARQHGCVVVSKDEDFHRLALLRGAPPKFVWIRLGNCTTDDIARLLRRRHEDITRFNEQNEATVLELG